MHLQTSTCTQKFLRKCKLLWKNGYTRKWLYSLPEYYNACFVQMSSNLPAAKTFCLCESSSLTKCTSCNQLVHCGPRENANCVCKRVHAHSITCSETANACFIKIDGSLPAANTLFKWKSSSLTKCTCKHPLWHRCLRENANYCGKMAIRGSRYILFLSIIMHVSSKWAAICRLRRLFACVSPRVWRNARAVINLYIAVLEKMQTVFVNVYMRTVQHVHFLRLLMHVSTLTAVCRLQTLFSCGGPRVWRYERALINLFTAVLEKIQIVVENVDKREVHNILFLNVILLVSSIQGNLSAANTGFLCKSSSLTKCTRKH